MFQKMFERWRRRQKSEFDDLEKTLEAIRFEPHSSLEAEIHGLWQRADRFTEGRQPTIPSPRRRQRRFYGLVLSASVTGAALAFLLLSPLRVPVPFLEPRPAAVEITTLDRCCEDLDGGERADDGVLIEAGKNETVRRVTIYEDLDGNGHFSSGDLLRTDPASDPTPLRMLPPGAFTSDRCCRDFDAGGEPDDGLFLVGVAPDRILLAAVYEDRDRSGSITSADIVRYIGP